MLRPGGLAVNKKERSLAFFAPPHWGPTLTVRNWNTPMNILVCVKQVPKPEISLDWQEEQLRPA
ncbi:hypothetical protein DFAR_2590005 [Desulfarculales bacterium]